MQMQYGLTEIGHGAVDVMFMYEVTGQGLVPDGFGYVADGIIPHAVTPGTEGIGDKDEFPVISKRFAVRFVNRLLI